MTHDDYVDASMCAHIYDLTVSRAVLRFWKATMQGTKVKVEGIEKA